MSEGHNSNALLLAQTKLQVIELEYDHSPVCKFTYLQVTKEQLEHCACNLSILASILGKQGMVTFVCKHKTALTCMPTSIEIVRDEETSTPSILERKQPKKKPDACKQQTDRITCRPDVRMADALCATILPQRTATVTTAMNGIRGESN